MGRIYLIVAGVALLIFSALPWSADPGSILAQSPNDYPINNGWFYSQTNGNNGGGALGYSVTNNDGVLFWTYFQRYGGVSALGYPISHRFTYKGFVTQAFQKVWFQWRPDQGNTVAFVNTLDELSAAGFDNWLLTVKQVPHSADWSGDAGLPFSQVTARHQALLDQNPAIKTAYFGTPDPISFNGLPMGAQDFGNVYVVRAQRTVFQQWKVAVPWANAGQVVLANGADLAKEAGLFPAYSIQPLGPGVQPNPNQPGGPTPFAPATATPVPPTATPAPNTVCNGDELMTFNPNNPTTGNQLFINVTSARASTNVGLQGPYNPTFQGVTGGGRGTIWTWVVVPTNPGNVNYNFTIGNTICTANNTNVSGSIVPYASWQSTAPGSINTSAGTAQIGLRNTNGQNGQQYQATARVTAPNGSVYDASTTINAANWSYFNYPQGFRGAPSLQPGQYQVRWDVNGFGTVRTDSFTVSGSQPLNPDWVSSAPRSPVRTQDNNAQLGIRNKNGQPNVQVTVTARVIDPRGSATQVQALVTGDQWANVYYPRDFNGARAVFPGTYQVEWTINNPGGGQTTVRDQFTVAG